MNTRQRVYLLRHGYSTWQAQYDVSKIDPVIYDAPLSERGREQVRAVAAEVARLNVDLVVTSPLTRAIETTLGLFNGSPSAPVVVHALVRERLGDSCDIGRPPAVLAREFPMLDFTHLPGVWWHQGPPDARGIPIESRSVAEQRAAGFREWLLARPERSILVVSHSGFLRDLGGGEIANCELREWTGELPAPRR